HTRSKRDWSSDVCSSDLLENVMVGATPITRAGAIAATLRLPSQRNEERQIRNQASNALARVGLLDWAREDAESLPLGQQRRVQRSEERRVGNECRAGWYF